ncbi:hypothetical protein Q31a_38590 [Aureliella helgolandensis]|uniref:Uncharacterized protein n=1 Tax=Aureliella helgolandensis TaxID=2527968 RepID=A0A518GAE4_9BACT|nr:hypothetical protein Q31a_38590 [Aureliella helgolandensis]
MPLRELGHEDIEGMAASQSTTSESTTSVVRAECKPQLFASMG